MKMPLVYDEEIPKCILLNIMFINMDSREIRQ